MYQKEARNKLYTLETPRQVLTFIDTTRLIPCCSLLFVYNSLLLIVECLKWGMHVRCENQCVHDLGPLLCSFCGLNWHKMSHSEPLRWEKIGKVVNWVKLAIPSHSEPLRWEKIGKVANWVKLAVLSHSEPLWWEKIGKVRNQVKLAILSHYEPLQWEKIGKVANWVKLAIPSHSEPLW